MFLAYNLLLTVLTVPNQSEQKKSKSLIALIIFSKWRGYEPVGYCVCRQHHRQAEAGLQYGRSHEEI